MAPPCGPPRHGRCRRSSRGRATQTEFARQRSSACTWPSGFCLRPVPSSALRALRRWPPSRWRPPAVARRSGILCQPAGRLQRRGGRILKKQYWICAVGAGVAIRAAPRVGHYPSSFVVGVTSLCRLRQAAAWLLQSRQLQERELPALWAPWPPYGVVKFRTLCSRACPGLQGASAREGHQAHRLPMLPGM